MQIKFYKPYITGKEITYIKDLLDNQRDLSGDGIYTKKVHEFLEKKYKVKKALLTTSGTTALEFAVRLLDLQPGDEIIVPSFTFSSTVNAILLAQGLKVIFAEIEKNTLNIDPNDIERRITKKTRAIIVVHYAGVACDMDKIMTIAKRYKLRIIEDAAQAIEAKYKNKYLGTIGDFGCLSFHDTKNITSGEGGALFINTDNKDIQEKAEIIREKGTNRTKFFQGLVDKYTWVDIGSSYLPSDILAAYLLAQLENAERIIEKRQKAYQFYKKSLQEYEKKGIISLPHIPSFAKHNAHIFYLVFKNEIERNDVMHYLRDRDVQATFHYIPLHSAPQGVKMGYKKEDLPLTEHLSASLLRLPLYSGITKKEQKYVISTTKNALRVLSNAPISKKYTLTIGIPAYNEARTLQNLINSIMLQKRTNFTLENITINCEKSSDQTKNVVKSIAKKNRLVTFTYDGKRLGKAQRLNEFYANNKSDLLLTLDADVMLADQNTVSKLVEKFSANTSTQVVAANLLPIKPKNFIGKIVYTNYLLWDETRLIFNNGRNIHSLYGAATMLRKNFARGIRYPYGITCDEVYLYIQAEQINGFDFARDSIVYYRPMANLQEFIIGSSRVHNERFALVPMLSEAILKYFEVPLKYKVKAVVKMMKTNPIATSAVIALNLWLKFFSYKDSLNQKGLWTITKSTKEPIIA